MILHFILVAAILLIAFSLLIIRFFIANKATKAINQDRRNQLNHELYDIRLQEVEEDVEQGVVVNKEAMVAELQYNLLDDIDENVIQKNNSREGIWGIGIAFLLVASVAIYSQVGAFKDVNDWDNALQRYPEIYKKLFQQPDSQPNEQALQDLALGLRTHLAASPNDVQGWVLYSRLGRVFKDKDMALGAMEKAWRLTPSNNEVVLEYIELTLQIGDDYEQATAQAMLMRFLQQNPSSYEGLSIYGFTALQQQDFTQAITTWEHMLTLVDENSDKASMLKQSILYAKDQLALQNSHKATSPPMQSIEPVGPTYQVTININKQVDYSPNSTLFVYAQAVTGSAMPIAAIKLPIKTFPVNVVLSDANEMVKGIKLSDHKQFVIKARISADGTVNQTQGQWVGESAVIKAGSKAPINIYINKQS